VERRRVRTIVVTLLAAAAIVAVAETARQRADPQAVTAWFASLRNAWYALPLVVVAFALLGAMLVPVMLLITATGIAFGPWLGPLYAMAGSLVSGSVGFGLGRWIGRERVERVFGRQVPKLNRALNRHGTLAVFVIRKIPLPFMLVNIAIGASAVRYRDFLFGTLLGMTAAVVALAGFSGTFVQLVSNPSAPVIAASLALLAVPLAIAWALNVVLVRRARRAHVKTGIGG